MSTRKLSNISLSQFQSFLELAQLKCLATKGGHEKWSRSDLRRPVVVQTHINPVPEFIVKNNLRTLSYSKNQFFDILEGKLDVVKEGGSYVIVKVEKKKKS